MNRAEIFFMHPLSALLRKKIRMITTGYQPDNRAGGRTNVPEIFAVRIGK